MKVCPVSDLTENQPARFEVDGVSVALVKLSDGSVYAVNDCCTHADVPLSEGFVDGETIECWAHGAKFCLKSGEALTLPASTPVATYKVVLQNGFVFIDLP
ncbi:non-heme iron oxygenase ferredoxin subunit [Tropheryma whipplei]|uniref:Dioxygenase ferredoxin subunit n=1 Tax=Tropheryma whipplei (strain Twist) TaxID=203267 RepID=Q83MX7_TROWT|nr:non-heme iron oxygenase ferredoxin subunit [Tropheryma whipplei]AAO44432.1 dioxygenase ferredoxin subunit [Tropheryma whipplei str. Twist]MCO8182404.1 non-heme iron oxygenase ferredoxin subunit [Tropheryma whipplei]MCO8190174.1 non-heme iron oxygenase ferredoxin subunit [Tropheryma whipplei]CAD67105.1 putative dioxygenase 2Fe-2S ferredoxin subunit [Tropheryma whipplei TW08/27]